MHNVETLYAWLNKAFPDKTPNLSMSDREIWVYVGVRKVIDIIEDKIKLSQETPTEVLREQ
jgi:hypothetical protein